MRFKIHHYSLLALSFLVITSCSEDPKLVEKREKQRVEITKLKGDVALIEEKLKNLPADVSADLAEAKAESEKQTAEVAGLESEVAALDARKRSLQGEYDAYRAKYQVK
jgi:chromosome segregation ATPase